MRLKTAPEDFHVKELIDYEFDRDGPFQLHWVRKKKLDTHEALALIARQAKVDRSALSFAGLKDRQGVTEQLIAVRGGKVDIRQANLRVRALGRSAHPVTSKMSRGNAFAIVLRDLDRAGSEMLARRAEELEESGFTNYFDDQRFGSIRHGQSFPMKAVLAGRHERALRLLIARPSPEARSGDGKLKMAIARHWGDWERCLRIARGPVYRRLFEHLQRNPEDFRGAIAQLPTRQKLIHAYAYQSHLWNRAVSRWLERLIPWREQRQIETLSDRLLTWQRLQPALRDQLRRASTPLPGSEGDRGDGEFSAATDFVLRQVGFTRDQLGDPGIPGMRLLAEPRAMLVRPRALELGQESRDEEHRGRGKRTIQFELPRGAYATMLIKWLQSESARPRSDGGGGQRGGRGHSRDHR